MLQEIIATGRDVNAAIDNGCRELGIDRDEDTFDFEIIARERKGFLGLRTYPAKVRVFREVPDPKPIREEKPPRAEKPAVPKPAPRQEGEPAPRQERPVREKRPAPPPRPQQKERPAREPREPREPRTAGPEAAAPQPPKAAPVEVEPNENVRARIQRSAEYVERILSVMGIQDAKVTPRYYEDSVCLQLAGTGLGVIIGRRGETLDSLQYLSSLVANRGESSYIRVNIDSGNYREKRERTLEALARKLAITAVRTGKSTTLEPMNPYERRVIHGAVSQIKGATSTSVGADPNRRVVISAIDPPASKRSGEEGGRGGDRRRDGRRRDGGRGPRRDDRRDARPPREGAPSGAPKAPRPKLDDGPAPERPLLQKPAEAPAPSPKVVEFTPEEKEVAGKTSLYGKIDL